MSYSIRKLELELVFVESDEIVEVLNAWNLRTEASKTMLLDSQNGAAARFKNLKLAMDDNAV
ncbi:hypothetical protein Goarm_021808 [Gossypium armourianum]|uniref:Uncharacterized protein n=1 Tax=Gossypium armourianum TaxID=34283 RepID=A0A7J9IUD3_9ROSI|nr:hypothetical protein [Gossypium armourianum]